jgi:hypothetical protein
MNAASPPRPAERAARGLGRLRAAYRALAPEQRLCGVAALGLVFTMFLPWYATTFTTRVRVRGGSGLAHDNQSAIGAFSWVEAAVLLVALGVLALLFARGERRAFHLPGGDGTVVTAAGAWAVLLIIWRFFDKPELGQGVSVGLQWGIFAALAAATALALAGNRLRAAHRPEPPMAGAPPPAPPPGTPVEVRIPDARPHLEETRVMPDRTPGSERMPLSRELAAQDTAEFRAVPQTPAATPDEDETQRMGEDATQRLPSEGEDQPPLPGMRE